MKFGVCNEIFQNWKFDDILSCAARIGYDGVELAPFTLARTVSEISSAQRGQIRGSAARHGLEICGLHWLLAKTEGLHLSAPDAAVRARTSKYLAECVDCCADLGGKVLVLGSPQQRNIPAGSSPEGAWQLAATTLRDVVKRAEDRAVVLCIEPLSPVETNFINSAAEAIDFAGLFHSPAAKIILDVKAMCSEQIPIPDIIYKSWPHFAHFHANDSNLGGPGSGSVDYTPIAAALLSVGFSAYVSVEVFRYEEGSENIATRSLEYLRSKFPSVARSEIKRHNNRGATAS